MPIVERMPWSVWLERSCLGSVTYSSSVGPAWGETSTELRVGVPFRQPLHAQVVDPAAEILVPTPTSGSCRHHACTFVGAGL